MKKTTPPRKHQGTTRKKPTHKPQRKTHTRVTAHAARLNREALPTHTPHVPDTIPVCELDPPACEAHICLFDPPLPPPTPPDDPPQDPIPDPTIAAGPTVSSSHTQMVQDWWQTEIAPDLSVILGADSRQYKSWSPEDQWLYQKYRFDAHFLYQDRAPPPLDMWKDGILELGTLAAQN